MLSKTDMSYILIVNIIVNMLYTITSGVKQDLIRFFFLNNKLLAGIGK